MQAADVMSAVQVLRAKAQAAGNLKSGSQITVVQQSPQVIVIQPANPQVVYVPQYNPTIVYGTPYVTPGYSTAALVTTGVLAFGVGIAVGAAMSNSSWGYSYWNCNWHGGTVVYRNSGYYGNAAWHGGYYGSGASAYGPYGSANPPLEAITRPQGLMPAARPPRLLTALKSWSGIQPKHWGLCCDASSLERLWELRKFGLLQERKHCVHPASNYLARICGIRTDFGGRQRCCGVGRIRQCGRRTDCKWNQVRSVERQCLQEHRQWLEPDPGHSPQHLKLLRG